MTRRREDQGFVLPGVLAYIAVALLVVSLGALALEKTQDNVGVIRDTMLLEQAMDDAEARAVFMFLTSRSVPYGITDNFSGFDATAAILGDAPTGEDENLNLPVWRADGGVMLFERGSVLVTVEYRDVTGFISLNSTNQQVVAAMLESYGLRSEQAQTLAAQLGDFVDEDSLRRQRGAERADYRLRQRPEPTNSPLRSIAEARKVLDWDELDILEDPSFIENATTSVVPSMPRGIYASEQTRGWVDQAQLSSFTMRDPLEEASGASLLPSARGRFTLRAVDRSTGAAVVRIVEVQRTVADISVPYVTETVMERALPVMNAAGDPVSGNRFPDYLREASDEG